MFSYARSGMSIEMAMLVYKSVGHLVHHSGLKLLKNCCMDFHEFL